VPWSDPPAAGALIAAPVSLRLREPSRQAPGAGQGRRADDEGASKPAIRLEASGPGLEVQEPPIWIPSLREMAWRIEPRTAGDYELHVVNGSESVAKSVRVMDGADSVVRRSPLRVRGSSRAPLSRRAPASPGCFRVRRRHLPRGQRRRLRLRAPLDDRVLRALHRIRVSAARDVQSHDLMTIGRLAFALRASARLAGASRRRPESC
jgi:hypothetical protein